MWLRLLRSHRVGVSTFRKLMAEYRGDAQAALESLPRLAATAGVKDYQPCPESHAQAELDRGRKAGAVAVFRGEPSYPKLLAQIDDAPILLWIKGRTDWAEAPMIALVGARNCSSLGQRMASRLAQDLGDAGVVVVSGLARGIDTAAHRAALATGTIAVLAGGIDVAYPAENARLTDEIAESGALMTEMPPGLQPQARHFPRRNRIISGLASGVVVVEAAPKSGSLITARDAADQGREVMAVPGHPVDGRAAGCNSLLRDGATLVRNGEDVLQACRITPRAVADLSQAEDAKPLRPLKPPPPPPQEENALRPATPDATALEATILALLSAAPLAEDQLLRDLRLSHGTVSEALLALELSGKIQRQPGGLLARCA